MDAVAQPGARKLLEKVVCTVASSKETGSKTMLSAKTGKEATLAISERGSQLRRQRPPLATKIKINLFTLQYLLHVRWSDAIPSLGPPLATSAISYGHQRPAARFIPIKCPTQWPKGRKCFFICVMQCGDNHVSCLLLIVVRTNLILQISCLSCKILKYSCTMTFLCLWRMILRGRKITGGGG